jgi:flavodoxin
MKRKLSTIFSLVFFFASFTTCGSLETNNEGGSEGNGDPLKGKVLVACFSRTETTATIAQYIHDKAGGDIFRIVTVNPYTADYNTTLAQARQELSDNARPALSGAISNINAYDTILLGYPIWHGYEPMAIRTFLESYDLNGKIIIPFCTSGSTGIGNSISSIRNHAAGATVLNGCRFSAGARADVNAWIDTLIF